MVSIFLPLHFEPMRLDSHHHFWDYSAEEYPWIDSTKTRLKRDFGPSDLKPLMRETKIDQVVSVQARQSITETQWLLDLADQHDFIAGVVGWLPLAEPSIRKHLERFASHPKLVSVRHVVHDEPDDNFILGSEFNKGIAQIAEFDRVYDILIFAKHLQPTIEFVDRHPSQRFVLDHIAKPTIEANSFDAAWERDLRELAKRSHVACKFSGVATEIRPSVWDLKTIHPYWDVALEAFGPKRLMYGSDWPVCLLKTEYPAWVQICEQLSSSLSQDDQNWFWSKSARHWYGLA
jgi:L-fuconolactonase